MTTLYYTVFDGASITAVGDPIEYGSVNISALAQTSSPLATYDASGRYNRAYVVRVFAASDCFVTWGEDPTITGGSDGIALAAGVAEYFSIRDGYRIAVIERT